MDKIQLEVKLRDQLGKGASNRFRESGLIPAILYGGEETFTLLIDGKTLRNTLAKHSWSNLILSLKMHEGNKEPLALIKEIQSHPISRKIVHVDLFEISMEKKVQVSVHIKFIGTPIGVKQSGGILSHQKRELKIECLANLIPEDIEVDITNLDIGRSIHVKDIQVGEGITIMDDPNITVAVINKAKETEKSEEPSTEEAASETTTKE